MSLTVLVLVLAVLVLPRAMRWTQKRRPGPVAA